MKKLIPIFAILMFFMQACGGSTNAPAATEAPANAASTEAAATEALSAEPIVHTTIPQQGTKSRANAHDREESTIFDRKDVVFGDDFKKNQFERPFTANDMNYLPDIDIVDFGITSDDQFFYIKVILSGLDLATQSLTGSYGVEIDRNGDGRGEILLATRAPYSTEFTADNVVVYIDNNGDIGGAHPGVPDDSTVGDGYDGIIFDLSQNIHPEDPDLAWVHFIPGDKPAIEIAYKKWIFKDGNEQFMWSVWASSQELDPRVFNLHDQIKVEEAGSPTKADPNYPIKVIAEVDNTCRVPLGFSATGSEPLGCSVSTASVEAEETEESEAVPFCDQFVSVCDRSGSGSGGNASNGSGSGENPINSPVINPLPPKPIQSGRSIFNPGPHP